MSSNVVRLMTAVDYDQVKELADHLALAAGKQAADVYIVACIDLAVRLIRTTTGCGEREALETLCDVAASIAEHAQS